jgi:hypothetical protein
MSDFVLRSAGAVLAVQLLVGCGGGGSSELAAAQGAPLVYDSDDRLEYYDVPGAAERDLMAGSSVALIPREATRVVDGRMTIVAPTWGEAKGLCPGERFAEQPAAAFCSGVLVDWDLVLTAGHCARVYALGEFVVAFDYFYQAPGELALGELREPTELVAEALDGPDTEPRLDYAWLRLASPLRPPRRPATFHARAATSTTGDTVLAIGAGGGVPLKLDGGAKVRDARAATGDYFVTDTDTSQGSSGGGVFDAELGLLGIVSRGGQDLAPTSSGCRSLIHADANAPAMEQVTYAGRALAGLCRADSTASSLCRADCGDRCAALPPPSAFAAVGCSTSVAPGSVGRGISFAWPAALLLVLKRTWPRAKRRIKAEKTRRPGSRS